MIHTIRFTKDCYLAKLLRVMSVTGEYPVRSLGLLGNKRLVRKAVNKAMTIQEHICPDNEFRWTCTLLTISGKGRLKSIRLTREGSRILEWFEDGAYEYYAEHYGSRNFSGNEYNIERNHRMAETVAMFLAAGIEYRPYLLAPLQSAERKGTAKIPSYYVSKEMKRIEGYLDDVNRTAFTRIAGLMFGYGVGYAVYNMRDRSMKWSERGEYKAYLHACELLRFNACIDAAPEAILFGSSLELAVRQLEEGDSSCGSGIFESTAFIPLDDTGIRLLRLIGTEKFRQRSLSMLFADEELQALPVTNIPADAQCDDAFVMSFLDCDISRLHRLAEVLRYVRETNAERRVCVVGYDHDADFLAAYLDGLCEIKTIALDQVEAEIFGRDEGKK